MDEEVRTPPRFLFVYGTLMSGMSAAQLMRGLGFVGPAHVQGALFDVGHPALVHEGTGFVRGELYRLPDSGDAEGKLLALLDQYECTASGLFTRVRELAWYDSKPALPAWAYHYSRLPLSRSARYIAGGDWRRA
jgi:gamma-glutamylcyclotransferase (GGCT)/AIG2-like uncharacterized protein YtfP